MTNTWLDKIAESSNLYECPEDFIAEECINYGDMTKMACELLCFFCDSEHDEMFVGTLSKMVRDYLDEVV